jgi:hypothetical protein
MHDTKEIEANARIEAKERMARVKLLGGYDTVAGRWHEFRPTESLGRPPLPLNLLSRIESKGAMLPPLSARSAGAQPSSPMLGGGDMRSQTARLSSARGRGSHSQHEVDVPGVRTRPLDSLFPRGFPMPGMPLKTGGAIYNFFISIKHILQ